MAPTLMRFHVDGADAGLLDGLAFLAELARVEHADAVAATGALGDELVHVAQRLDGRVVLLLDVGRAEFSRRRRCGEREREHATCGGDQAPAHQAAANPGHIGLHRALSLARRDHRVGTW